WSVVFFGFKNPFFALLEIVVLWAAILGTVLAFMRVSRVAAALLLPYILWVSFAVYLNYAIWRLNG
ncbi:MAG: TspO/MBR family protein, partial [bacterium]|nr:TspO/MBR family protein [bacterium]